MKRILSALTALCMCASLTAGALPAYALNALPPTDAIVAQSGGHELKIVDTTFDPEKDAKGLVLELKVYNDQGTAGLQIGLTIDGKYLDDPDCPFTFKQALVDSNVYGFGGIPEPGTGYYAVADSETGQNKIAPDGATFMRYLLLPKADVDYAPGTVYDVEFAAPEGCDLLVGYVPDGADDDPTKTMEKYTDIIYTGGTITIPGGDNEPTQAPSADPTEPVTQTPTAKPTEPATQAPTQPPTAKPTQAPTQTPTAKPTQAPTAKPTQAPTQAPTAKPTQAPTQAPTQGNTQNPTNAPTPTESQFVEQQKDVNAEWVIGNTTAKPGEEVTLDVSVKGNTDGFNSYITKLKYDNAVTSKEAANGIEIFDFVSNNDEKTFGGTDFNEGKENYAEDGTVFSVKFVAPTKPGRYMIEFDTLEIYDASMTKLNPKTTAGWIEVVDDETEFVHDKKDTAAKWIIGKEEAEPGETVRVPVSVQGDKDGINSYKLQITQDDGPVATNAAIGDAYAELGFEQNLKNLSFGGTNHAKNENIIAPDGDVFYIEFKVPDDAAPGSLYNLKFADIDLEDIDMTQLVPQTEDGWIRVKSDTPVESAGKWVIGKKTVAPGEEVTIPVTVTGDVNGLNSYIMKMGMDKGPVATKATNGNAYEELSFVDNLDNMSFGGTNTELKKNLVAEDGAVVFNVTFTAPTEPGRYNLTFDNLEVYDINKSALAPEKENGWIEVVAETTEYTPQSAGKWIIGKKTVAPGAEVTIPVTVEGDVNGLNSYIMEMGMDKGPVAISAANGEAYAELSFENNLDNMKFGGTNTALKENLVAENGAAVFYVTFTAPEEPGKYDLTFDNLEIFDINQAALTPEKEDGWIEVVEDATAEPTTEPATKPEPGDPGMWIIGTATVAPGAEVTIPVTVKGDANGLNSYLMKMGVVDGPVATAAANGNAYEELSFVDNLDNMTFAGTNTTLDKNLIAEDDAVVFNVTFTAPTKPGKYDLTFDDLQVYDIDMSALTPKQQNGWIEVVEGATAEPTTEPPTAAPTTEPATAEPTKPAPGDPGTWIIGTATVAPGAEVTIPVTVKGDANGLNSYLMEMGVVDGPVAIGAANGDAYEELSFVDNLDNMTFAGTNTKLDENLIAEDGAIVFNVTFTAPTKPGKYDLTFEDLQVYDIDMSALTPKQQNGWIEVVEGATAEPTTEPPTAAPTTEPPTAAPTTEPATAEPTKPAPGDPGTWIIGTATVAPGAEVTIPVTVKGDANGLNSYLMEMGVVDGPVAIGAANGDAYEELSFVDNLDNMTFAGTNTKLDENLIAEDGAIVFNVTFTAPTKPGKYDLTFEDLQVYDIDMSALTPKQQNGWIEVVEGATAEPTTAPSTQPTTAPSTEPTTAPSTQPATTEPTEPTTAPSTQPATKEPTQPATTEPTEPTTAPSTQPATKEPTQPTTAPSTQPATKEPTEPTTAPSTQPATKEPTEPVTTEPPTTEPPTETQTNAPTEPPTDEPTGETESQFVKPVTDLQATWEIGKRSATLGEKNVKIPVSVEADDLEALSINAFDFSLDIAEGPTYTGFEWGTAYEAMADKTNNGLHFMGENSAGGTVQADNASSVIILSFDIPADAEPGRYAISFDGEVTAQKMSMADVDVNEVDGYIDILPDGVTVTTIEYQYNVEGKGKFYFAHDPREFDPEDLLSMSTLRRREKYSEPIAGNEYSDWTIANEFDGVSFEIPEQDLVFNDKTYHLSSEQVASPKGIYDTAIEPSVVMGEEGTNAYFRSPIEFTIVDANAAEGVEVKFVTVAEDGTVADAKPVTGEVFIGVKGDTSLNGIPNAVDAALVLTYAANYGAGQPTPINTADDELLENFVYFLSDVTGESEDHGANDSNGTPYTSNALNAEDAAYILVYAAEYGAGNNPDWYNILPEPLPKYTKEIGPREGEANKK